MAYKMDSASKNELNYFHQLLQVLLNTWYPKEQTAISIFTDPNAFTFYYLRTNLGPIHTLSI